MKSILSFFLFASIFLLSAAQTKPSALEELVKDNYAVVKQTPEDPYRVRVEIYLDNKDATNRNGKIRLVVLHGNGAVMFDNTVSASLEREKRSVFPFDMVFPSYDNYSIRYSYTEESGDKIENNFKWLTEPVNFFYAFTTPHRVTTSLPDDSNKTLLDLSEGMLSIGWTYDDLNYYPYASFLSAKHRWRINIQPELNGKPFPRSSWSRMNEYLPMLRNTYESDEVDLLLEAGGAKTAMVVKVTIHNKSDQPQHVRLPCARPGTWNGYNLGWVDDTQPTDNLLAGWSAPADQVLILGVGADGYPLNPEKVTQMNMDWMVAPGKTRTGWLIRPYNSFMRDLDALRAVDWQTEFDQGCLAWKDLYDRTCRVIIPDEKIVQSFHASIADIFVMREPIGKGYIATVPGTDMYRSGPNSFEPAIATVALAQVGLSKEAEIGFRVNWDLQTEDGDWTEPGGWGHLMWGATGYKAWAAMEYYFNTKDNAFLEKRYPQMLAASRWQNRMRERTKKITSDGQRELTYGLMPVGMGDGGLMNDNSYYGIFYTHNIWAVHADSLALLAAQTLGRENEARELREIYLTAKNDLIASMRRGAIVEPDGTRWLSSMPGKVTGSSWGLSNTITPTQLLKPFDELIDNTLARVEKNLSPGGVPTHTGFMVDGMWVAITLNDFALARLARDESDIANAYLYATLNHASPLYSWCEERGLFPGTTQISGDIQHLWTPIAVVRFIRDMLVMEEGSTLRLARGIARGWLASGEPVGIENASTRFGNISYKMHYDAKRSRLVGQIRFPEGAQPIETTVHCPLPEGMQLTKTSVGKLLPNRSGIILTNGKGVVNFEVSVRVKK